MADYYIKKKPLYPDLEKEVADLLVDPIDNREHLASQFLAFMDDLRKILDLIISDEQSKQYEHLVKPIVKKLMVLQVNSFSLPAAAEEEICSLHDMFDHEMQSLEEQFKHYFCMDRYFFYHFIYGIYAQIYYKLFYSLPKLDQHSKDILDNLSHKGFYDMNQDERDYLYDMLKPIYKKLDAHCKNKNPKTYCPLRYVVRRGYVASQYDQSNQIFMEKLDDDDLDRIGEAFKGLHFNTILQHYYKSHYGVNNVRVWRFFPKGGGGQDIRGHFDDGFPPNIIKIMAYPGDLKRDTGCFQVVTRKNKNVADISGHKPAVLIDTPQVRHKADAPKPGTHRDSIEISMMPMIHDNPIYIDAGCRTGAQLNPFRSWSEEASQIVTV